VQGDHVHLIVEAAGKEALARGMKAVASRLARAVQSVLGAEGKILFGRYQLRILRTPREVRNALAYVLLNLRKHWQQRRGEAPSLLLDEASSGRWFDGWRAAPPEPASRSRAEAREVAQPHTWLLACGWRRHGLIDPAEVPGR